MSSYSTALLTLRGMRLGINVSIPFIKYRPSSTNVTFRIEGPDVTVGLTLPKWNTRSLYSRPHRSTDIGRVAFIRLDVSYCYHAEVHPENVDQLCIEITVRHPLRSPAGMLTVTGRHETLCTR